MGQIAKDTPLAEITLRKYESPNNEMSLYEISRRVMLSLGLLQPGDSRDVIVDVFVAVISNDGLDAFQIEEEAKKIRSSRNVPLKGCTSPNVRRQITRLKNLFLIHKHANVYVVREEKFSKIWDEHIKGYYMNSINSRIRENLSMLDTIKNKNSE
jgi:hypothetical protein